MQDRFRAKTWMLWAVFFITGAMGLFATVFGALFWTQTITDADGKARPQAGPPMVIVGTCLIAVAAMAASNLIALMRPVIRCYREGLECNLVGATSLDGILGIPRTARIAWKLLSLQGFRAQRFRMHWSDFQGARVTGIAMAFVLRIDGPVTDLKTSRARNGIAFAQHALKTPPHVIADTLQTFALDPSLRDQLPTWE